MNTLEQGQSGVEEIGGKRYMRDGDGKLTPIDLVHAKDQLRDEMVRKCIRHATALSAQIARFRAHCFDDISGYLDLLKQEYGVTTKKKSKGNMTFLTFDGCFKIQVAIADQITFGPELQIAKQLIDECIVEWAGGARDEIRALVDHAFEPQKEGKVNREALFRLRSLNIEDERWRRAVDAINDAIRVVGSKQYIRFYHRETPAHAWRHIPIDLASAEAPVKAEG